MLQMSASDKFRFTESGLNITADLDEVEWAGLGKRLVREREGNGWALVDWLVYGGRFTDRGKFVKGGYTLASSITGYSESYLSNLWNLGQFFTPELRQVGVPMAVHRVLMREQNVARRLELLNEAAAEEWTSDQVLEKITGGVQPSRQARAERWKPSPLPPLEPEVVAAKPAEVTCPHCGHTFIP